MPDKIYKNKKEFNKANQAYNDSLSLYNNYMSTKPYFFDFSDESKTKREAKSEEAKVIIKRSGINPTHVQFEDGSRTPYAYFLENPPEEQYMSVFKKPATKPVYEEVKAKTVLEPIKPLGIKPMNTSVEAKLAGNVAVPEIPKTNNKIQNYTGNKALQIQGKPSGYINEGDNTGRQEFRKGGWLDGMDNNIKQEASTTATKFRRDKPIFRSESKREVEPMFDGNKYVLQHLEPFSTIKDITNLGYAIYNKDRAEVNKTILSGMLPFVNHSDYELPKEVKDAVNRSEGQNVEIIKKRTKQNGGWLDGLSSPNNVIEDNRGQWAHPGKVTKINSNQITMKGVNYPVLGVSDSGDTQMMQPGKEYNFKGKTVTEYPQKFQLGGNNNKYVSERDATSTVKTPAITTNNNAFREKVYNPDEAYKYAIDAAGTVFYPASLAGSAIDFYQGDNVGGVAGLIPFGKGYKFLKGLKTTARGRMAQKANSGVNKLIGAHVTTQVLDAKSDLIDPLIKDKKQNTGWLDNLK
jgi:hypothetical protein